MSWEEFLALPSWPRAEWVDGEVVLLMAPPVFDHGSAQTQLITLLAPLFPQCYVVPEVCLELPRNRVRLPDVMLVAERPDDDHPAAEVELGGVSVPLDIRQILRP